MPTTKNLDNLVINKVANEDVFRSMLAQGLVGADDISFVLGNDEVTVSWENIENKPTTLSGYGISDAINSSEKGANNGVATLGSNGKVPTSQLPTIPPEVTESTVSGWGFTKNTGTVTTTGTMTANHVVVSNGSTVIKDSGFTIAKSVPSNAVFTDTTYESKSAVSGGTAVSLVTTGEKYTWNNKGTYSKPSGGIPKTDLASAVQTSLGKADTALQSYTETDPVFSASAAAGITSSNISTWNAKGTYSKPSTGIPKTDLASAVQTSLGKADSAIQSSEKGAANGVATLDSSGKIPTTQIKQQIIISSTAPTTAQKFDNMLWYQIL